MRSWAAAIVLCAGCGHSGPRTADRPSEPARTAAMRPVDTREPARAAVERRRITLVVTDADVRDVIDAIARLSRGNIVVASDVRGKITASFHDVPWDAALEAVVKSVGKCEAVWESADVVRIVDP